MRHLPLIGMILAGSLAGGGCTGALIGHFTVTGGLSPGAGWGVPDHGVDADAAAAPPPVAARHAVETPRFAGYYPAQAPVVTTPAEAAAAERAFDALYDDPPAEAFEPAAAPEAPLADDAVYSVRAFEDGGEPATD